MSVGRNEPCPCGSGKKYKQCCLLVESSNQVRWRMGPLLLAVLGIVSGAVLFFTHDATVGGPVIAAGIIIPIAWTVFTDPPPVKANTDDAAAMKFGK